MQAACERKEARIRSTLAEPKAWNGMKLYLFGSGLTLETNPHWGLAHIVGGYQDVSRFPFGSIEYVERLRRILKRKRTPVEEGEEKVEVEVERNETMEGLERSGIDLFEASVARIKEDDLEKVLHTLATSSSNKARGNRGALFNFSEVRDLVVHTGWTVVAIHAESINWGTSARPNRQMHPTRIEVFKHETEDPTCISYEISVDDFPGSIRNERIGKDAPLFLVVVEDSVSGGFQAIWAPLWPDSEWLGLPQPRVFDDSYFDFHPGELDKLKRQYKSTAGFTLTESTGLLETIFFVLDMSDVAKGRRTGSSTRRSNDPQGQEKGRRNTVPIRCLTKLFKLEKNQHNYMYKYLNRTLKLWKQALRRRHYRELLMAYGLMDPEPHASHEESTTARAQSHENSATLVTGEADRTPPRVPPMGPEPEHSKRRRRDVAHEGVHEAETLMVDLLNRDITRDIVLEVLTQQDSVHGQMDLTPSVDELLHIFEEDVDSVPQADRL